ncbi:MAG: Gfo/Idh/MocA family oxidoreductase [Bacteroidales bacterium]|nr:Gfo/Idh/MocA family oxidoreductase [Bacteroidales bacterium]
MNVVVIGLGSMGKRRIRLLKEHQDIEIYGIDSNQERCNEVTEKFGVKCFGSISEAVKNEKINCAFVCTSPLSHSAIINECLENNLHIFTEINLVSDGYDANIKLAKEKNVVLFLSSTFLYRKETQMIIDKVKDRNSKLNYIYHVGQYLPDWHPWESYNNYFIGNPKTNGCREIMAIDMPWLITAFGKIKNVSAVKSKNSNLNINYNDNYLITIEHETGAKGVFAVDVVTRKPIRHIDVYGEDIQISWNGTPDSLTEYDIQAKALKQIAIDNASEHVEGYAAFVTENPYREEINAFLSQIKNAENKPQWDFVRDAELLKIIDKIEA